LAQTTGAFAMKAIYIPGRIIADLHHSQRQASTLFGKNFYLRRDLKQQLAGNCLAVNSLRRAHRKITVRLPLRNTRRSI
jgi:hypothetical protein